MPQPNKNLVMTNSTKTKDFLDLSDHTGAELLKILKLATEIKSAFKSGKNHTDKLSGKSLAMIFEKNSTRTRVSFEVGAKQIGMQSLYLSRNDLQLGRGETIGDTAQVLSRYVDMIMIRCLFHDTLLELAKHANVPVINGLTNKSHPCQVMADVMTYIEHRGDVRGKTFAWIGDTNNVFNSLTHAAALFGFNLNIACPEEYRPSEKITEWFKANAANSELQVLDDPFRAAEGADCVFTDAWVSMGDQEAEIKKRAFQPYRITVNLMAHAKPDALFMHCLPAYRWEEVVPEVIDGPQSVVLDEAENRLHIQKAIMLWCAGVI
jgi:ornithine carbamoyltransferase